MKRPILIAISWVVALHTVILIAHSAAHFGLHVLPATVFDYLFIAIVISILPLIGLFMVFNSRIARWGAILLFLSMLGALIYGLIYHFLLPGMDNVAHSGPEPWHTLFVATSYLLLIMETVGTGVGLWSALARSINADA